jgi:ribonucleoside-diphosphate reductase alpha chain
MLDIVGNTGVDKKNFIEKEILFRLGISDKVEEILDVFQRVATVFGTIESWYWWDSHSIHFRDSLLEMMQERKLIPSTTILMNAGRIHNAPISACTVPPVDLKNNLSQIKKVVDHYHFNGMGTGFNFDDIEDPIPIIRYLNQIGVDGQKNKKQLRPVGNMGIISIDHPKLIEFMNIKNQSLDESWVFNFSVLISDENLEKIKQWEDLINKNGVNISSTWIMNTIAKSIHLSGEPGIIFIDRLNADNQVPDVGEYKSLAPCWEIWLTEGETCQFSYINLWSFVTEGNIDFPELERCTRIATRFLDNTVEYNISRFKHKLNKEVAKKKRRIGIGVCGLADLLKKMNINYNSKDARIITEDVISFINYISKKESMQLAKERWAFEAFSTSKYLGNDNLLSNYSQTKTNTVSNDMWVSLENDIKVNGLRNCSTIAIPPTGRSSYIIGASSSIEPYFQEILDISPTDQLLLIQSVQKFTDESISKTVNIPEESSINDINAILRMAMDLDLKWVTVYRDKSRSTQPQKI